MSHVIDHIVVDEHRKNKPQQVRNIGAMFDAPCTVKVQVIKTAHTAWLHLRKVTVKFTPTLNNEQTQCVIHAYVTSSRSKQQPSRPGS